MPDNTHADEEARMSDVPEATPGVADVPAPVMFQIFGNRDGPVRFECELTADVAGADYAVRLGFAIRKAIQAGVNLAGANLRYAKLRNAYLRRANLSNLDLRDADLQNTNLNYADFRNTDLRGADLTNASIGFTNFQKTVIDDVGLQNIRDDLFDVLATARAEAPAFLVALRAGKIDGSTYEGKCACLVGTIANARGVDVYTLPRNVNRPIELFVRNIKEGDTPETNPIARLVAEWTETFINGAV